MAVTKALTHFIPTGAPRLADLGFSGRSKRRTTEPRSRDRDPRSPLSYQGRQPV